MKTISTDIDRYQGFIENALSKVDLSIGTGIYMLPSNLTLGTGKTVGYNNNILVSITGMKIVPNRHINKDHKKLTMTPPEPGKADGIAIKMNKPIKDHLMVHHEQISNQKCLPKIIMIEN